MDNQETINSHPESVAAWKRKAEQLQAEIAALKAELAAAVPQCTHKYEIDSDHPNHSCCQNCGEILKDGVHVQPVAQARSRAGMLAAAEIAKKFEPDERDGVYFPSDAIREAAKK